MRLDSLAKLDAEIKKFARGLVSLLDDTHECGLIAEHLVLDRLLDFLRSAELLQQLPCGRVEEAESFLNSSELSRAKLKINWRVGYWVPAAVEFYLQLFKLSLA